MGVVERPRRARPASQQLTAYAPVGRSGDFTPGDDKPKEGEPRNWILAGGLGWLYGMGVCVGPFFGVGVGLSFPGGVIAGAAAASASSSASACRAASCGAPAAAR